MEDNHLKGLSSSSADDSAWWNNWCRSVYGCAGFILWTGPSAILAYLVAGLFLYLVEAMEKWFIYTQQQVHLQTCK